VAIFVVLSKWWPTIVRAQLFRTGGDDVWRSSQGRYREWVWQEGELQAKVPTGDSLAVPCLSGDSFKD